MSSTELVLSSHQTSGHRQYARPPIVEVILQFTFAEGGSDDGVDAVAESLSSAYPHREELFNVSAAVPLMGPVPGAVPLVNRERAGLQLQDASPPHKLVRVSRQSLSIHEVRPWSGWLTFQRRAQEAFDLYCGVFPDRPVIRIGLRYINRIELPPSGDDLKEWITSAPDIPEGLPQFVETYSVEMAMPQPEPGVIAIVRQALLADPRPDISPIVLDVELQLNRPITAAETFQKVRELHEREYLIFERSITDRVRRLFE